MGRRRPAARRPGLGLGLCSLLAWILCVPAAPQAEPGSVEYRVKAAFLYNFARFVEWPTEPDSPISFCILGEDPFGSVLDETLQDKTVSGQPLEVQRVQDVEAAAHCEIVFVSVSENRRLEEIFSRLDGRSILTVGDTPRFTRSGGVINFVTDGGKVRFEINVAAAERSRLSLSSKLLNLARIVGQRAGDAG